MLERLDKWDRDEKEWLEIVVEDRNATPADVVRVRLDFADWLKTLPRRDRKVALDLRMATGPERSHAGTTSPDGRISQLRKEMYLSWQLMMLC